MVVLDVGDGEFSYFVTDTIITLNDLEEFDFKIWIQNVDLPFEYDETYEYLFLQEAMKVSNDTLVEYILYDMISYMTIIKR